MDRKISGARLQQVMKEQNLKQVDILKLARPLCQQNQVKLNKSDLSQYVSGKVVPGKDKVAILSTVLGVNEAWLLGYDVPKTSDAPLSPADTSLPVSSAAEPEPLDQALLDRYQSIQQKMNSIAEKLVYLPQEQMESVLQSYHSIADVYFDAFQKQRKQETEAQMDSPRQED